MSGSSSAIRTVCMADKDAPGPWENQGTARRALAGARYVPRGIAVFAKSPSLWVLGLLPPFLALVIVVFLAILVGVYVDDLVLWATPFADAPSWSPAWRTAVRVSFGIGIFVGYVLLAVISFAAVTNLIGQPFFEMISDRIEQRLGNAPVETETPWWRTLPRATAGSIFILAIFLSIMIPLFILGFVPVVGQSVVPVVAAIVSGFFLSIEIMSIPLDRRGMRLRERLRFHWRHRAVVIGFGIGFVLLFMIPLMNIVAMPSAIVGGTLLARRLLGVDKS